MARQDWFTSCPSCKMRFATALEYAEHMRFCPAKCARCKDWFTAIGAYLAHPCRPVSHLEDLN